MSNDEPQALSTQELNDLRRRIYNGYDYSYDEIKQAIQGLRAHRQAVGDSGEAKKSGGGGGKKKPTHDLSDLA